MRWEFGSLHGPAIGNAAKSKKSAGSVAEIPAGIGAETALF